MKITERIVAHVAKNPVVRYADLCAAVGISTHAGHVAYVRKTGRVFSAGPRSWQRYFPTAEQAWAAEADVQAEAKAAERERNRRAALETNRRRKAASRLLGRSRNTRPTQAVQGEPSKREFVVYGKRIALGATCTGSQTVPRVVDPMQSRPWAAAAVGAR